MLSYKIRISALVVIGFASHLFAQSFTIFTDERWLSVQLPGHPSGYVTPSATGANFNGYLDSYNSAGDYYVASQDSMLSPNQLVCNSYLNLQGTLPPDGSKASFGTYCSVNFSVTSPTVATFAFNNFLVSNEGFTYDGLIPTIGITSDDPNFNPDPSANGGNSDSYMVNAFDNQSDGSMQFVFSPSYTYTFYEQMTGFGMYDPSGIQTTLLNATLQVNMSLTMATVTTPIFVPEPSSVFVFLLGAGLIVFWGSFRLRRSPATANAQP